MLKLKQQFILFLIYKMFNKICTQIFVTFVKSFEYEL